MLSQGQVLWDVHSMPGRVNNRKEILGADAFLAIAWVSHKVGRLPNAELFFLSVLGKAGLVVSVKQKGAGVWEGD